MIPSFISFFVYFLSHDAYLLSSSQKSTEILNSQLPIKCTGTLEEKLFCATKETTPSFLSIKFQPLLPISKVFCFKDSSSCLSDSFKQTFVTLGDKLLKKIDPYSKIYLGKDKENFNHQTSGRSSGFGAYTHTFLPKIYDISSDSPASILGFEKGDLIFSTHSSRILGFKPKYNQAINRSWSLHNVPTSPVSAYETSDHVLHVRIRQFIPGTALALEHFLKLYPKATSMIWDLRGNPGGYFDEALKVLDLVTPANHTIVNVDFKDHIQEFMTTDGQKYLLPLKILTDNNTASSAEIVAGSLKKNKRAQIYGEKSYGKGTIQNLFSLDEDMDLKLTVGEYHFQGDKINHIGITPHQESSLLNLKVPKPFLAYQPIEKNILNVYLSYKDLPLSFDEFRIFPYVEGLNPLKTTEVKKVNNSLYFQISWKKKLSFQGSVWGAFYKDQKPLAAQELFQVWDGKILEKSSKN